MANTRIPLFIVIFIFAAFHPASIPRVHAEEDREATAALLTSAPWKISGAGWADIRMFDKDGKFTTKDHGNETGHWRISDKQIVLTFTDGHKDTISLPLDPKGTPGADQHGNPTTAALVSAAAATSTPAPAQPGPGGTGAFGQNTQVAAAQTPPPAPLSPELQKTAGDLVKTYHNSLVFVTGKAGSGSGFITTIGKTNFLVTNAHVAAGITDAAFKTLDDTPVQGGAASVAIGRDIFCMAMPAGGTPLEIMQDVEGNAAIGDDVVVLGNAEGQGVINTITGKIVGIGPNLVEVDAPFVPGNSGSPIIHLKTGKVVGVATYTVTKTYDETTNQKIAVPIVRRFGYRLDNVKSWQGVEWRSFYAQAAEMDKIETLTADLGDFFDDIVQNKGVVTAGRHTNPVIKNRIDEWLESKTGNMSATDESMANANFLSFLKVACQADVTAARQHMTYDYFQRELADEQRARDEMSKSFTEIIKEIRN